MLDKYIITEYNSITEDYCINRRYFFVNFLYINLHIVNFKGVIIVGYSDYFNLVARVIRLGINSFDFMEIVPLTDDAKKTVDIEIDAVLTENLGYFSGATYDKLRLNSESIDAIIKWCNNKNDKYIFIYLLMRLDRMVNVDRLCSDYGVTEMTKRNRTMASSSTKGQYIDPYFDALNDNCEETNIVLIPNFRTLIDDLDIEEKAELEAKAVARMSGLNEVLCRLYFINKSGLKRWRLNNVIYDPKVDLSEQLTVAFTPTTSKQSDDVFDIGEDTKHTDENGRVCRLLGDIRLRDFQYSTENFLKCLESAREEKADIFIGTEMFGTDELCGSTDSGMNLNYISDDYNKKPFLIVTPTQWKNHSNSLSVFSSKGELLGKQFKQFGFSPTGKSRENLQNIPREILVIHIRNLGRVAFPICADLIDEGYRNLLINRLKIDFIFCPSYSPGTKEFEKYFAAVVSIGSYAFWLNSCSAVTEGKHIGLVTIPTASLADSTKRIFPECDGLCSSCVFYIKTPVKRTGRLGLVEQKELDISHKVI